MRWIGVLALSLAACDQAELDPVGSQDAPTTTASASLASPRCEAAEVSLVEDLASVSPGFVRSPQELLALATGSFVGEVTLAALPTFGADERESPGSFDVDDHVVEVRLVTGRWSDDGSVCDTWYEVPFVAALASGDGQLAEAFGASLLIRADGSAWFEVAIPAEQLQGGLRPSASDPAVTELVVRGELAQDLVTLDVGEDTGVAATSEVGSWVGTLTWEAEDTASEAGAFWFTPVG
jgi:hypothetical protein